MTRTCQVDVKRASCSAASVFRRKAIHFTIELHVMVDENLMDFPALVFAIAVVVLWISARTGLWLQKKYRSLGNDERDEFGIILGATLTLLGLILGFSFSMAISRYDQRKNYEEEEANAIGTEYLRTNLLPGANAANARALLSKYLDARIHFYTIRDKQQLQQNNALTAQLQNELWSAVQVSAPAQQTAVAALAISGMNDLLNSQGYTQAAWWNRIPREAWALMGAIAICSNVLVGFGLHQVRRKGVLLIVLPLILAITFGLIADIDSPRGGLVHVEPLNLESLAQSLRQ
jgi:hypothetical protein